MLTAYADESFANVSAFGGYVASVEQWDAFNVRWGRILDKFDASVFHFREWVEARAVAIGKTKAHSSFDQNPYCGWKERKLNLFLYELAELAGTRKQGTFGGFISLERFNQRKAAGEILIGQDHRDYCLKKCFESFIDVLNERWPRFSEPVSFVWDKTKDTTWKHSIINAYEPFEKANPHFASISFADDKLCFPLQAADMVAYRIRQKTDKRFKGKTSPMSDLDNLLFGEDKTGKLKFFN